MMSTKLRCGGIFDANIKGKIIIIYISDYKL